MIDHGHTSGVGDAAATRRHRVEAVDTAGSAAMPDSGGDPGAAPAFPLPARPPLPRPERLNRNALTIVAVIMGFLVIAAVVLVPPARPGEETGPGTAAAPAPQASYLDQPGTASFGTPPHTSSVATRSAPDVQAALDSIAALGALGNGDHFGSDRPASVMVDPSPAVPVYAAPPMPASIEPRSRPAPDARAAAYRAALEAPVTGGAVESLGMEDVAPTASPSLVAGDEWTATAPVTATWIGPAGASAMAARTSVRPQYQRFLADAERGAPTAIRTSVAPAPGTHTVQAGAVVPALLLTEVNSDLPGNVLAQVTRDVFDSQSQTTLLIPKGARLLGRYSDQVGLGQNRLLLAWTRILLPDGRSIALPGMPAQDATGAGGVGGRVERHGRRVLGSAALLSLIGAGIQLSQPNGGYGVWGGPSAGQVVAGAAGQQLAQVMSQMMQRNLDVRPTIRLAQGTPFNVFLTADLTFPGAYVHGEDAGR